MEIRVTLDIPVMVQELCSLDCPFLEFMGSDTYCNLFLQELAESIITLEAYRCDACRDAEVREELNGRSE